MPISANLFVYLSGVFLQIILLVYILYGGFLLLTSAGDPKKMEAAKGTLTNGAIGFVIVFAAYWIVQGIGLILGIGQIQGTFK